MKTYFHVFEMMTRNPYCATPQTPVPDLVRELVSRRATAAPVIDSEEKLVGLISLVDVAVASLGGQAARVGDLMQRRVHSIEHSATLTSAAGLMRKHRVHRLVVTDHDRVAGVLSCLDLLAAVEEVTGFPPVL